VDFGPLRGPLFKFADCFHHLGQGSSMHLKTLADAFEQRDGKLAAQMLAEFLKAVPE